MNETIKVYPSNIRYTEKKQSRFQEHRESIRAVLKKRGEEIRSLEGRHPKAVIFLNYIIAILIVALIVSCVGWRIQVIHTRQMEEEAHIAWLEQKAAAEQKEQERQAAILAEQRAIAEKQIAETTLMAKVLAGLNGFVENYGYSEGDLRTYAECIINRVVDKSHGFPNTITEVIMQENQWVGFSENNQVIEKYNKIATEVVGNYYNGAVRPCSSDYCWVELRRDGCWLKNEYSDSPYVKTWRYTA